MIRRALSRAKKGVLQHRELTAAAALALVLVLVTRFAPAEGVAGLAATLLVAGFGAAVTWLWPVLAQPFQRLPRGVGRALAVAIVTVMAWKLFRPAFDEPVSWNTGDWGPHHVLLKAVIAGLRRGHVPQWIQAVASGDAPFDTYPVLTYLIAAAAAFLSRRTHELPLVLMAMGTVVHSLVAVGVTRLAARVAAWPVACLVGLVTLLDIGMGSNYGTNSVLYYALLHFAVCLVFLIFALVALVDGIARPSLGASVAVWVFMALAGAAHPSALQLAAAAVPALAAAALLARDVPRRRLLVAAFHLGVGVALGAVMWLPLSERLVLYASHYSTVPTSAAETLDGIFGKPLPRTSFAPVVYLGYVGMLAALFSRKAVPTFLAVLAGLLLLGFSDLPYLLYALGPSPAMARMSTQRLSGLSKPAVYALAGYAVMILWRHVLAHWRAAPRRQQALAGAIAALVAALGVRAALPFYREIHRYRVRADVHQEALELEPLVAWARTAMQGQRPDAFGRLLVAENEPHWSLHVAAETGLPVLYTAAIPAVIGRERLEDAQPATLKRFDVRWVVARGRSPSIGEESTEKEIGPYHIRELADWDGRFARVERGGGEAVTTRLEDERVEVELRGTDRPSLVALGTGYYPRWRARHESGRELPVYSVPVRKDGLTRVPAAWLPPGRTVFTPDGPLPSDGKGRLPSFAALGIAVAILVVWSWPRLRARVLRRAARERARLRRLRRPPWLVPGLLAATAGAAAIAALVAAQRPARALRLGLGLFGAAKVEARLLNGPWRRCRYDLFSAFYRCPELGTVTDAMGGLVNDARPSWPFTTPILQFEVDTRVVKKDQVEFRVETSLRLAGPYWVAASGGPVKLEIEGLPAKVITKQETIEPPDRRRRRTVLSAIVGTSASFAMIRQQAVQPDRPWLRDPPEAPP